MVDPAGRGINASRSQRNSASTWFQIQEKVKSELLDAPLVVPVEETGQATIEAPTGASVRTHIQPLIEKVIGVAAVASTVEYETEPNSQLWRKVEAEPALVASVEYEKYEQTTPVRRKFKSENGLPRTPASLTNRAFSIDIDFAEQHRIKLEEDARDLDKEIQEAEHLAELRRKKAAVMAKLEAVNTRVRRSTSFSSPRGSIA